MTGSRGKNILKLCTPSYGQNLAAGSKIHKDDDRACPIQQNVQKTDVLRDITQYPSTSGTQKQMNISDLKDSSDEEDVTSGSEYFPASDDEDPEESKDIQENTSIAKTNEEEIETSGAGRKNVGTSSNRKEKSIVIHVTADGLNVKKQEWKRKKAAILRSKGQEYVSQTGKVMRKSNKVRSALQGELSQKLYREIQH
ncbi:hypothetical protein JTB14_006917 [Gonioctena quinquepunctata]|nr:hypothetical protein JTB14_006917 [Gonioctena quinquepunctata]